MLAPQARAGVFYLDFTNNGGPLESGWTQVYGTPADFNVGQSGTFTFPGVATYNSGNVALAAVKRCGFYYNGDTTSVGIPFTLKGLTPNKPVKLYACDAWDLNAGAYIVYGDSPPVGGVKALTLSPGNTGTLANMTLIGTKTADANGWVTGTMHGKNGVGVNGQGQAGGFAFVPTQTITASVNPVLNHGSISNPGALDLFATATQSYTITADSGYHVADVLVDGTSVGAVTSYTFTNLAANHTIAASFAVDTASYTITASAGANGSISPTGEVTAFEGTSKPFTITANTGYHIADVLVDGASVGAVSSYTFTNVTSAHSISASFAVDTFTLTASAGANGSISPAGASVVNYGASQIFTFTPASGYYVSDVLVDGVAVAAVPGVVPNSYTFSNVTANHTISANFDNRTRIHLDFAGPLPNGTSPNWIPVRASELADTMVNVADVDGAGHGFTFDHVATYNNDTLAPLNQSGFYNFGGAASTHAFNLTGLIPGQLVSLYACSAWDGNGNGGYIVYGNSGAAGVKALNVGTINTTPALANLTLIGTATVDGTGKVGGSLYGSNAVVGSNGGGQVGGFVFATEAPPVWTITASAGGNGSISPNGPTSVVSGSNQSFTITANSGYHVADVLVDGNTVGAVSSHTFNTVTANHTISATFAANTVTYTVNASAGTNGTISPDGATVLNAGVNKIYTITPDTGYHIANVLVDGSSVGTGGSYTFTAIAADHTISASFAINTYTVTASAGANGSISPTGPTSVNYNGSQTYTITPASGYLIDDVQVDGFSVGTPTSWTFDNVVANHTISVTFDDRAKLKLDFTTNGGPYTANWTQVQAAPQADTMVEVANVGGSPYGFAFSHVAAYSAAPANQSLTRAGFYNVGNTLTDHTFTLTGLNAFQTVSLYASAAWDGNANGGFVVFGDSGAAGVKAQTVGDPGTTGTQANLTLIGTATADNTGTVTGSLHGADGVGTTSEGQVGGFIFAISPGGTPPEPPTAFDTWATLNNLTGGNAQPGADPDFDGVPNIIEFALSGNPNDGASKGQAFSKMATVSTESKVLTYTIAVLDVAFENGVAPTFGTVGGRLTATAQGITYTVEAANNLSDWGGPTVTEVTDGQDLANIQDGLDTPARGWSYKTFRTDGNATTDPSDFIRVSVK